MGWNRSEFYGLSVGILADALAGGAGLSRAPRRAAPVHGPGLGAATVACRGGHLTGAVDGLFGLRPAPPSPGPRRPLASSPTATPTPVPSPPWALIFPPAVRTPFRASPRGVLGLQRVSGNAFSCPSAQLGKAAAAFGGVGLAAGNGCAGARWRSPSSGAQGNFCPRPRGMKALTVDVSLPAVGRHVTPGPGAGSASRSIDLFTVLGGVGSAPGGGSGHLGGSPEAPAPESALVSTGSTGKKPFITPSSFGGRRACSFSQEGEPSGCGRNLLWARMPGYSIDAVALAIIADYMPLGAR